MNNNKFIDNIKRLGNLYLFIINLFIQNNYYSMFKSHLIYQNNTNDLFNKLNIIIPKLIINFQNLVNQNQKNLVTVQALFILLVINIQLLTALITNTLTKQ